MDFFSKDLFDKGNTAMVRLANAVDKRNDQNSELEERRMTSDVVLRRGSAAFLVGDDLPGRVPVFAQAMSNEHLAMLRALAEDEGEDKEVAEVYAEGNKDILGIQSDVLLSDLVSAYLDETKRELDGSTEDADRPNSARDIIRGSRRVFASFRGA
jgi:hypothetical protein